MERSGTNLPPNFRNQEDSQTERSQDKQNIRCQVREEEVTQNEREGKIVNIRNCDEFQIESGSKTDAREESFDSNNKARKKQNATSKDYSTNRFEVNKCEQNICECISSRISAASNLQNKNEFCLQVSKQKIDLTRYTKEFPSENEARTKKKCESSNPSYLFQSKAMQTSDHGTKFCIQETWKDHLVSLQSHKYAYSFNQEKNILLSNMSVIDASSSSEKVKFFSTNNFKLCSAKDITEYEPFSISIEDANERDKIKFTLDKSSEDERDRCKVPLHTSSEDERDRSKISLHTSSEDERDISKIPLHTSSEDNFSFYYGIQEIPLEKFEVNRISSNEVSEITLSKKLFCVENKDWVLSSATEFIFRRPYIFFPQEVEESKFLKLNLELPQNRPIIATLSTNSQKESEDTVKIKQKMPLTECLENVTIIDASNISEKVHYFKTKNVLVDSNTCITSVKRASNLAFTEKPSNVIFMLDIGENQPSRSDLHEFKQAFLSALRENVSDSSKASFSNSQSGVHSKEQDFGVLNWYKGRKKDRRRNGKFTDDDNVISSSMTQNSSPSSSIIYTGTDHGRVIQVSEDANKMVPISPKNSDLNNLKTFLVDKDESKLSYFDETQEPVSNQSNGSRAKSLNVSTSDQQSDSKMNYHSIQSEEKNAKQSS